MGAAYEMAFTAQAGDIDIMGHVNNAVWVRWMEAIATAHWESLAPADYQQGTVWVVTRHEIDYRGNVREGEAVTARTWIADPPKGARFERRITFTGPDGKVKVEAHTIWAMVDKASGRIARVPAGLAEIFLA